MPVQWLFWTPDIVIMDIFPPSAENQTVSCLNLNNWVTGSAMHGRVASLNPCLLRSNALKLFCGFAITKVQL